MNEELSLSHVKGKGNLKHNERDYDKDFMPSNIAVDRTRLNVSGVDNPEGLEEVYCRLFPVDDYNAKQKRSDRKMTSYFENEFGIPVTNPKARYSPVTNPKTGKQSFFEDVGQSGYKIHFSRL